MNFLINAIALFWLIRTVKLVLFWIYLWQLKNYHVGRFVDHFRTHQGKKLLFNPLFSLKVILLPFISVRPGFAWTLLAVYVAESIGFLLGIAKKSVKLPVFTKKVILLTFICLLDLAIYGLLFHYWAALLLIYDIFIPVIVSVIVLLVQPFFVLARHRILRQAKAKMVLFPKLVVVGITGSYGKTSTKEFLTTILSAKYKVLATPEHKNSEIGIAQTILHDLTDQHEIFVVEMGAYNKGGIKLLCDMVKPKIGIVTGVNQQHLATFGSLDNLLSAEGGQELAESLGGNGLLIVNGDSKHCLDLYKSFSGNKKAYTLKKDRIDSDIWTEDVTMQRDSLSFIVRTKAGEIAHIQVPVLGQQQAQNMLGAVLVARHLGMGFEQIAEAAKNITQSQAGMTLKKGAYGIDVIDASYSSNPDGVMADLDYLSIWGKPAFAQGSGEAKKIIIMPCLIELGDASAQAHYDIGKKIATVCDMAIITTKDQFEQIKKGATENGLPADKIIFCSNSKEIFTMITTSCKEGDAVLLEGRVPSQLIKLLNG